MQQGRQPSLEGIDGVNGTFRNGVISTGKGVEPLPHHQVNRGLQAVTDIVHVMAIRDHFIDPAVCEVRHELDLLIDNRDPLEVVEESLFVSGVPRRVQVALPELHGRRLEHRLERRHVGVEPFLRCVAHDDHIAAAEHAAVQHEIVDKPMYSTRMPSGPRSNPASSRSVLPS